MKVEDYEYIENDDLEDEITLTDERKYELIKKVKDQIVKENIAVHKILRIGKSNTEYNFIFDWLTKKGVKISGINGILSGELEDYTYIKKLGISQFPEPLEENEQQKLFIELKNMKKKGVDTNSKEYQDIRQKLIVHNIRLAIWTVGYKYERNFTDLKIEKEDLQQMAMETLIKAVDKYDVGKESKFSSYAVTAIYYNIGREWSKNINNDTELRKEWSRLERFEEEMLMTVNRQPTDEEIKEFLGINDNRLNKLKEYINYHIQEGSDSLNKDDDELIINELLYDERMQEIDSKPILNGVYIDEEEPKFQEEPINIEVAINKKLVKESIEEALDKLTEREKKVLELRFGLKDGEARNLEEVRKIFNVTRERIRQIESKALRKLRNPYRVKILKEYLKDSFKEEWNKYSGVCVETKLIRPRKTLKIQKSDEIFEEDNKEKEEVYYYRAEEQIAEENIRAAEELAEENITTTEETIEELDDMEQVRNLEENSNIESYLNEISELLSELNELDKMLKQTSIEIKNEKNKEQKNKELKAKMKKVEDLMQK